MDVVWLVPIEILLLPIVIIIGILWFCREWLKIAWELIKNDWKD